jgi:hypothetical protein
MIKAAEEFFSRLFFVVSSVFWEIAEIKTCH